MSADNYYWVGRHPGGGFTAVMGFASDETFVRKVGPADPKFDTALEAIEWAQMQGSEYGVHVDWAEVHRDVV